MFLCPLRTLHIMRIFKMEKSFITKDEFKKRLADLYARSGALRLPRRQRDRHILLKSIALILDKEREYTQPEINSAIGSWLSYAAREIKIDHVWLRRQLVDAGYITRDKRGKSYQLSNDYMNRITFEPSIDEIDPYGVIRNAYKEIEQRKNLYKQKRKIIKA